MSSLSPAATFDGGIMDCGSGLILLIRQQLLAVPEGGVLELLSQEPTVEAELPPWCRMVGHEHISSEQLQPGHWRHLIRRLADEAKSLAADQAKARDYEWRCRARQVGGSSIIYARSVSWQLGQVASFEEKDAHPSAVEALLGALASDVITTFGLCCQQRGIVMDELELNAKLKLHNVLAHLGAEEGDPSVKSIELILFVTSPAGGDELRAACSEAEKLSPLLCTLRKGTTVNTRLVIL